MVLGLLHPFVEITVLHMCHVNLFVICDGLGMLNHAAGQHAFFPHWMSRFPIFLVHYPILEELFQQ